MFRIFLDFDGVIANSAIECINTSYNAWAPIKINDYNLNESSNNFLDKELIIETCIKNRFLVIPPEHYFCLIESVYEEINLNLEKISSTSIEKRFHKICNKTSPLLLRQFKQDLFQLRNQKFKTQTDYEWVTENPPTLFTKKLFKMIEPYDSEILIVSRKNYLSISKWVAGTGYKVDGIFGNEELVKFGNSKFNLISNIQLANPVKKSVFVDDMKFEFDSSEWSNIGVKTLNAGWGYNNLIDNTSEILKEINRNLNDIYN